jgi:hypothetical protein
LLKVKLVITVFQNQPSFLQGSVDAEEEYIQLYRLET